MHSEIRVPRFLIRFLIVVEKTTCTHGCGLYIESFTVQYCGLKTLSLFWLVFVTSFLSHVMYCVIFEKKALYFEKKTTCIEILT